MAHKFVGALPGTPERRLGWGGAEKVEGNRNVLKKKIVTNYACQRRI